MDDTSTSVFVGRDAELAFLRGAMDRASDHHSQTVVIEGEGGIGKTTLVERFLHELDGVRLIRARGDESETHVRFAMADQLLRAAAEGPAADVLGNGQHVRVGMELLELMTGGGGQTASVVVVDDAHLVDSDSLRALLFAARRLGTSPVLVLLVVRDSGDEVLQEGWLKLATDGTGGWLRVGPLTADQVSVLGGELGVIMSPEAARRLCEHTRGSPLHTRAVLRELPHDETWQHEHRPLPAPRSYAQLVLERLSRLDPAAVRLIEAAAVLGVRSPLWAATELAQVDHPLETLDDATESGLLRLDDRQLGAFVEFSHPLARSAIYEALSHARRSELNVAAAEVVDDPGAAIRHRVEAATVVNEALLGELERLAHAKMARGAWAAAVSHLLAASRLSPVPDDRERLALEAIDAMMYSGDGASARRLAERTTSFAEGPRRDSVLAYLAIFAGDLETAQRLLTRAWDRRDLSNDDALAATIAQRSAFLATSRLRGSEAIEWAGRAQAFAPDDLTTGLLCAPSLALGLSFVGRRGDAHAALDRWLDHPDAPRPGAGFVLLTLQGFLLLADGDLRAARAAFVTAERESLEEGLLVVAALSLSGLTRVEYAAGDWDAAVVSAQRAIALALESDDHWIMAQAHWSASYVPCARGEWQVAEGHLDAIRGDEPTFERHIAARAIAVAGVAAAQERPDEVLAALEPLERMPRGEGVDDPAFLPWHHLKAHALVDAGLLDDAEEFLEVAEELAERRSSELLAARLAHARGKLEIARRRPGPAGDAFTQARELVEPLGMPYELALIELAHGQLLRRGGERRAAAAMLVTARGRLADLGAGPALARCEKELAACGLAPSARKSRDYTALTPQELAVTRLVVSGMTNREVSAELMLSTKTVEFHLSNIYTKMGVRSRAELRARARANELDL